LQDENNVLIKELSIEKEKLHTLEAAFEQMRKRGTVCAFFRLYSSCRSHCFDFVLVQTYCDLRIYLHLYLQLQLMIQTLFQFIWFIWH